MEHFLLSHPLLASICRSLSHHKLRISGRIHVREMLMVNCGETPSASLAQAEISHTTPLFAQCDTAKPNSLTGAAAENKSPVSAAAEEMSAGEQMWMLTHS